MAESWKDYLRRIIDETPITIPLPTGGVIPIKGKTARKGLQQGAAGAVEGTVANSARKGEKGAVGGYRPAILDVAAAPVGLVASLINRRNDGKPFDGSNTFERYVNNSMERLTVANERTNKTLGIQNPRNMSEMGARVLGGLAIPGPKGATVGRAVSKVPGGAKVVTKARALPKPVKTTATVAAEIALPLRQTGAKGATISTGIVTPIADVVADVSDPDYKGSVLPLITGQEEEAPDPEFDMLISAGMEPDTSGALLSEDQEFDSLLNPQADDPILAMEAEDIEKEWSWQEAGAAIGAIGLAGVAARYAPSLIKSRIQEATASPPRFVGKKFRRSKAGALERFRTNFIQQDQPLRNAADEWLSPQQADEYKFNADLINNVSIGARASNFFRTGKAPKTNIRTVKLAPQAEAFAKELDINEQRAVEDALVAQSALDDFDRTGSLAALNKDRFGTDVTPAQLRAMVHTARSNPKFVKHMDAVVRGYQDLLKFRVDRGMITVDAARELATKRPNYVRLSRDLETEAKPGEARPFNANENRMAPGFTRAEDEGFGVQGQTGVGNPFNLLFEDWASEIRRAEVNDLRAQWLENMTVSGATTSVDGRTVPLVRRLPSGVAPDTEKGIHRVTVNGRSVVYKVNDERLFNALEFQPRATWQATEMMRQVAQNTITGPLGTLVNGFSIFKSPLYDTTIGMLNKPKDVHLGLINEMLSNINPNLSIGRLDPTALVSAFTGAARYGWDNIRGNMAQTMSEHLIREHSWLRDTLGTQRLTTLRDHLQGAYENSVKSLMDDLGITSLTMHGSPDPSSVMSGLEGITPKFSSDMAAKLAKDTTEEWANGRKATTYQMMLSQGKSAFARARSDSLATAYGNLLEAMHNGFRYSMVAANRSRNPNLAKLASQARRISIDSAQHGGSDIFNKITSSFMYANLSIQTLHGVGTRMLKNPVEFAGNFASVAIPLTAMHYLALATDPDAAEQHKNKTASQKASSVTTFGGAEIPIDPFLRLSLGPAFAVLDHVTGAHDGNWNGDVMQALSTWLEGDYDEEGMREDAGTAAWEAIKANNPYTPEALPGVNAAFAYAGIDPGMTRISGEASPVRTQSLSGFDADEKRPDSLTSGYTENMITSLLGTFGQGMMNMANDAYRAFSATNEPIHALEAATERYRDTMAKGSGVTTPLLFSGYERLNSVADTNWNVVHDKQKGIDAATTLMTNDFIRMGQSTNTTIGKMAPLPVDAPHMLPQVAGTANEIIGGLTALLNRSNEWQTINQELSNLAKQSEALRNGYGIDFTGKEPRTKTANEKNVTLNELTQQRKYYNLLKRQLIEQVENDIRQRIGDPDFSFDGYNPDDYMTPIAPVQ
jgi:hypothetical protein